MVTSVLKVVVVRSRYFMPNYGIIKITLMNSFFRSEYFFNIQCENVFYVHGQNYEP